MKHALLADIHGNLEALEVVLDDCQKQGVTHYACLGDVVGYNANPRECLEIIRQMGMPCVKGNHDEYCSSDSKFEGISMQAAEAVQWTRRQLSMEDGQWLRDLRYQQVVANFTIVHATLDGPQRWGYVSDRLDASASFAYQNTSVCFFGHTHVPMAYVRNSTIMGGTYSRFRVEQDRKYFINAGSVGQSRDGVAKATYVIYNLNESTIELRRLDYDIPKTQQKILAASLPPRLAERLAFGQ